MSGENGAGGRGLTPEGRSWRHYAVCGSTNDLARAWAADPADPAPPGPA